MKHHAFATAMGLLIAAALVPASQAEAASADPIGIWRKADQGERPGKFEIFHCGKSNKLLCAKIVWLQDPNDSKGRPLHDVRNENPSMRDRPILGLPIFSGLQPVGPNVWKGNIYNPEDGNTYSVTVTQVSRNQINVKGCKAWLLCGERTWLRSSLPKEEVEPETAPETQIEAAAEPEAPVEQASVGAAAQTQEPAPQEEALSKAEILTPATEHDAQPGYRFLNASTPTGLSGESVPSMFVMTKPIATDAEEESETTSEGTTEVSEPAPAPTPAPAPAAEEPKPAPRSATATAAATPRPKPVPSAPVSQTAAAPADPQDAVETAETETAETAVLDEQPLTRREKRLLRRQQKGLLPWLAQ